jgi:hypothetical protein
MNAKSEPRHRFPTFVLCEDVRQEIGGKLSYTGVYAAYSIAIDTTQTPKDAPPGAVPAMSSLCCILSIFSEAGEFPCSARVIGPSNKTLGDFNLGVANIQFPQPHIIALKAQPFLVPELGTYTVRFSVGKNEYEFDFDVVSGPRSVDSDAKQVATTPIGAPHG